MITINDKNYDNILTKVSFGEYSVTQDDKRRVGEAPFISFEFNNINLGIETTYDKKWLKELNLDDKKDISEYISDIVYKDEEGFTPLITGTYKCFINKIKNDIFVLELDSEIEEDGVKYKILLKEEIQMDFE